MKRLSLHRRHLVRQGLLYSLALVAAILLIGGVGFWWLDPNVNTISDGLWLSFTTAATVGYGDVVPSTHASRFFAVIVVLLGLAVLSLVTASLAAIFVEKEVEQDEKAMVAEILRELHRLRLEVRALNDRLDPAPPRQED
jgi:voltage-gated potassium channel